MFRSAATYVALSFACGGAAAQSVTITPQGDTLTYRYTPAARGDREAAQSVTVTPQGDTLTYRYTPAAREDRKTSRGGFFKRLSDKILRPATDIADSGGYHFSIFGGPSYSTETSLKLGAVAMLTFRTDDDLSAQPSDISLSAGVSITGFYRAAIAGNTFFKADRHRLMYDAEITSQPTDFWGLGYRAAIDNPASKYTAKRCVLSLRYRYALWRNIYIGAYVGFSHVAAVGMRQAAEEYIGSRRRNFNTAGLGVALSYDSRDYTVNAYRGAYLSAEYIVRPDVLGNVRSTLWQVTLIADWYRALWRDCIMAVDLYGEFHNAATPWLLRAEVGNDWRMRGYYRGRFNGDNLLTAQVELRQRIWNRLGCTVWAGAGNVFSHDDPFAWSKTLPNYGAGLRWEFKRRSNLRVDWGMGRKSNSFVLSINEAF